MIARPVRRRRRLRLRWRPRHPLPYWLAVAVLLGLTVSAVGRVADAAAAERDRWGRRVPVAVAVGDHDPGEVLRAEVRLLPRGVVPAGALARAPDGEVAAAWIAAGEIVLERRLAPAGLSPTAAMLPSGTRGVAVPQGIAPLPVVVGDRVDVLGPSVLATGALVVAVEDDAVTVAVRDVAAPRIADAVATGTVTLVLTSPER